MKKLLMLFPLVVAVTLALLWRQPATEAEQAGSTPTAPTPQVRASSPATVSRGPVEIRQPSAPPPSFAGTQVDGQFRLDAAGNLLIDGDVRRVFDYFLSALGEEPLDSSVLRLRRHIEQQLKQPAEGQTIGLLGQYLDYKRQLLALEQQHSRTADLVAMRERLDAARALRARVFDAQTHQAFFATEEARDEFTLARLAILHDPYLSAAEKGDAIDRLHGAQPAEMLDAMAPRLQQELRAQTRQLQASGATPAQLRQLRQQLVGNAAAERLEALDAQRRNWLQRLNSYRAEKTELEQSRGLSETDREAAIARLTSERFSAAERLRLEAAEQRLLAEGSR